jgi:hypothetical protein
MAPVSQHAGSRSSATEKQSSSARGTRPLPPAYNVPDNDGSVPLDFDSLTAVLSPSS